MTSPSSTSSSEPVAAHAGVARKALFAALAIVVLVEGLTMALAPESAPVDEGARFYMGGVFPTHGQSMVQWQVDRLDRLEAAPEVLILGDSSALCGLIPAEIAARTGVTVENMGLIQSLSVEGARIVLERLIETRGAPRLVVFQFTEPLLSESRDKIDELGWLANFEVWLGAGDRLAAQWPTYRLRAPARAAIGGYSYGTLQNDDGIRAFLSRHHGFFRDPKIGELTKATHPQPVIGVHPDALEDLGGLFALTASNGIGTIVVHAPVPELYRDPANEVRFRAVEQATVALAEKYSGVQVIVPFERYAPTSFFTTYQHLSLEGAQIHSGQISQLISERLAP